MGLILICVVIWSLIFCKNHIGGHFRTARSGVYIGLRCICKWSRSLRESSGIHVYSIRRIENSKWVKSGFLQSFSGLALLWGEGLVFLSLPLLWLSLCLYLSFLPAVGSEKDTYVHEKMMSRGLVCICAYAPTRILLFILLTQYNTT